jgi:acyl-CoA synthetase (AMP-forming)/AMP-acid ligase II
VQLSLYKALDNDCKNRLRNPDADVFVGVLARGGYSFSVLLFAIYALGAVAVPLCQ